MEEVVGEKVQDSAVRILYNLLGSSLSKISFFFGVILIFLAWVLDQWGEKYLLVKELFGYDMGSWFFSLGLVGIFVAMFLIVRDWISWRESVRELRKEYPVKFLDKKFYLVSFRGSLYLFDKRTEKRRWVKSWMTASDLGFHGYVTRVGQSFSKRVGKNSAVKTDGGVKFDISKFKLGEGIHTRGAPGS